MKMTAYLGMSLSALGLVAAPVAEAATLPTTANVSVAAGTRVGQGAVAQVHRASTSTEGSSNLLGIPLLFVVIGGGLVVVGVVAAAGGFSSSPGS